MSMKIVKLQFHGENVLFVKSRMIRMTEQIRLYNQ